jgi:hypothetical protein
MPSRLLYCPKLPFWCCLGSTAIGHYSSHSSPAAAMVSPGIVQQLRQLSLGWPFVISSSDYCHFPIWDTGHMRIWGRFSTPICALRRSFNGLPRGISASYVAKGVFGPPLCRHVGNPISALFYILRTHFWGPLAPFLSRPPSIFCPRPGRFRQWIFLTPFLSSFSGFRFLHCFIY